MRAQGAISGIGVGLVFASLPCYPFTQLSLTGRPIYNAQSFVDIIDGPHIQLVSCYNHGMGTVLVDFTSGLHCTYPRSFAFLCMR